MSEATLLLAEPQLVLALFGARDQHVRAIRTSLGVSITYRNGEVLIAGDAQAVARATTVFEELRYVVERGGTISSEQVRSELAKVNGGEEANRVVQEIVDVPDASRRVRPRTAGQSR